MYSRSDLIVSDSQHFKDISERVSKQLIDEKIRKYVFFTSEEKQKFREKLQNEYTEAISGGCCFGRAASLLKSANKYPTISKVDLVKRIKLEDVIRLQLLKNNHIPNITPHRPPPGSHGFPPEIDLSYAIPWKEETSYFYEGALYTEKSWIECFGEYIESNLTLGRIAFDINKLSGHTFALWHTGNKYGFYDGKSVYEFSDLTKFVKSVRNKILEYRNHYIKNKPEIAIKNAFLHVVLHLKPNPT